MYTAPIASLQTWFPERQVIPLWSGHQTPSNLVQSYQERMPNDSLHDRAVFHITHPEIVIFEPEQPNGIGILLIPGGGYQRVAVDKEGADSARVLNKAGFTVFMMTYRLPDEGHEFSSWTPLADAQRAMRILRQLPLASQLSSIGVLGFSAGGHVAASLAVGYARKIYPCQDEADSLSAKPDFCALMYPVISMDTNIAHMGSRAELMNNLKCESDLTRFSLEQQVTSDMPPCFLLHASDDTAVKVENSVVFWQALRLCGVTTEMHLFEQGDHGFGIRGAQDLPVAVWPQLLAAWLQKLARR